MSTARALDQFYTSRAIAAECIEYLKSMVQLDGADLILEPSAGDGAFFEQMKERLPHGECVGVDLEPKCQGVETADFLSEFSTAGRTGRWITCGNPPFGKNASLAVRFFNKAAEFSEVIAFVVPLTFRKQSLQRRLARNFRLLGDKDLPLESFVFEGKPYSVPCCFQVWVRDKVQREVAQAPLTHKDFDFVSADSADLAIRRVGGLAGKVILDFHGYSPSSHYYLKANIDPQLLAQRLSAIDWGDTKWNTAGNPSISKRELVAKYAAFVAAGSTKRKGARRNRPEGGP